MVNGPDPGDGMRRVAVVGVGAVTSLGPTADHLLRGAMDGRVAIESVQGVDMRGSRPRLVARSRHIQPAVAMPRTISQSARLSSLCLLPARRYPSHRD